jgi:hypothetical protein
MEKGKNHLIDNAGYNPHEQVVTIDDDGEHGR